MASRCDDPRATGHPGEGLSGYQVGHLPYRHRKPGLLDPSPGTHPERSLVKPFDAGHAPSPVRPVLDIAIDTEDALGGAGNLNAGLKSDAQRISVAVRRRCARA